MCHWVGFSGRSVWDSMQIARGSVKQLGCHVSQFISLLKSVLTDFNNDISIYIFFFLHFTIM